MGGRRNGRMVDDLAQAAAQFAQWRRRRLAGDRIPGPLWQSAVELARRYGLCPTAKALKLGYYSLKERLEEQAPLQEGSPNSALRAAFVELPAAPLSVASECTIELEKPGGSRMRIQLKNSGMPDLAALSHLFWDAP